MRMKRLKNTVAFVIVAVVVLAVLLAFLRVSQAADSSKNSREGEQMEQAILRGRVFLVHAVGFSENSRSEKGGFRVYRRNRKKPDL